MPLSINVGLSRKASKDYQSTGVSINVTAELDHALLSKPQELQQQIDHLYHQAEQALDRHASVPAPPQPTQQAQHAATNGGRSRNGNANGHGNGGNGRGGDAPMTASQRRAIESIARRLNLDPDNEAEQFIEVPLDQLALKQASELIDHLKGLQPAENGRGR
jgi:cell division septum initiation protein DivIVA